jgi:hypothetical protein
MSREEYFLNEIDLDPLEPGRRGGNPATNGLS